MYCGYSKNLAKQPCGGGEASNYCWEKPRTNTNALYYMNKNMAEICPNI